MTVDNFVDKWIGKGIDFDGHYGFQCVDLYRQYLKEVYGTTAPLVVGAKDIWDKPPQGFEKIVNTPDGIPQKGDIVIWGATSGNKWGHVAIALNCDVNVCRTFDQNFPTGSKCRKVSHKYNNVIGWLHKDNTKMTKLSKPITISTKGKLHPVIDLVNMVAVGKIKVQAKFPDGTPFEKEYTPTEEVQIIISEIDELKKKVNGLYGTINQVKKENEKLKTENEKLSQIGEEYEKIQKTVENQKEALSVYASEALESDKRYKELSKGYEALEIAYNSLKEEVSKAVEEKIYWKQSYDNLVLECKKLEAEVARVEAWGSVVETERDQLRDLMDLSGSRLSLIWKFILALVRK